MLIFLGSTWIRCRLCSSTEISEKRGGLSRELFSAGSFFRAYEGLLKINNIAWQLRRDIYEAKENQCRTRNGGNFIGTFMTAIEGTIVSTVCQPYRQFTWGSFNELVFSIFCWLMRDGNARFTATEWQNWSQTSFLIGPTIFVIGSLLSGLSQSMEMLIIFRAIQGIGAGAIMPVTLRLSPIFIHSKNEQNARF